MNLKKNQILWFLGSIALVIAFIILTPITLFFKYGGIISIIEGLICAILIAFGTFNISSLKELENPFLKEESGKINNYVIPLVSSIILGIVIYNIIEYRIDTKIKNEGKFTEATVLNGEAITSRMVKTGTNTTYNISISFKDSLANRERNFKTSIDADIFNSVYKGQTIGIKYLPNYPSVFKFMVGDNNINQFKNVTNRDINFSDIENLINDTSPESQMEYLKSISEGWKKSNDEKGTIFNNELKNELIAISKDGKIFFEAPKLDEFIPKKRIINTTQLSLNKKNNIITENNILYETDSLMITKVYRMKIKIPKTEVENFLMIEKK